MKGIEHDLGSETMLLELSIKNFAIIQKQQISFHPGLTVLTGETGAGKSILIDAIAILLGGRGSADLIRYGEEKAEIEGLFQFDSEDHPALTKVKELDIETEENSVIFRRVLTRSGKSTCYLNGRMVKISTLKEVGIKTIDIHGQHEHQELMDASIHLGLLDKYGANKIAKPRQRYQEIYHEFTEVSRELKKYTIDDQMLAQKLDLLRFQKDEISKASLIVGEEEALQEEKAKLNNFEKIQGKLQSIYSALSDERAGIELIGSAKSDMEAISHYDEQYQSQSESLANAYYILEDISLTISSTLDDFEFDEARLGEVESRLDVINSLKRKYGDTIEGILAFRKKVSQELSQFENRESRQEELTAKHSALKASLVSQAGKLTVIRHELAKQLAKEIQRQLKDLYMEKAQFAVHLGSSEPNEFGVDVAEFFIAANPGEPLKPLTKTASGGELSRIMLAIKTIFSSHQGTTSIIFDEIDTGVSGRVAQSIAEKIYQISIDSQVFCISHLPHVASMADTHLLIAKEQKQSTTSTSVRVLEEAERIIEIGRMISGKDTNTYTEAHVKEMFLQAESTKERLLAN